MKNIASIHGQIPTATQDAIQHQFNINSKAEIELKHSQNTMVGYRPIMVNAIGLDLHIISASG